MLHKYYKTRLWSKVINLGLSLFYLGRVDFFKGKHYSLFIFPPALTMSAGGKEPLFSISFFSFRGPILDWFRQILLYSHWSTQSLCSKHTRVPATDEAVLCTLMTVELAMGIEQNFGMSVDTAVVEMTYFKHSTA